MKSNRKTIALMIVFFLGLLTVWGLDRAGVRTRWDEERRAERVLPELIDTPAASVIRVTIDRGEEHLVFERAGGAGAGRWQMTAPRNVAAEPSRLESLVRNLIDLRKSRDAGTLEGPAESFGLGPPAATIRLYTTPEGEPGANRPAATLEVGKVVKDQRYVRAPGGAGTEVVDARMLAALDQPLDEWRQPVLLGVPTFQVAAVSITRRGEKDQAPRVIKAERGANGHWKLTAPMRVPASGGKIEVLLSALASLRVAGPDGFAADDVKDFAPFGLDPPRATIELTTTRPGQPPLVLDVGGPVPEKTDRVYVRQGGQNDVVIVDARALSEVPEGPTPLRSKNVSDIVPAAVQTIEIQTRNDLFKIERGKTGWRLVSPRREKADTPAVESFLAAADGLQASEFLEPGRVRDPELSPPIMTIRIDQPATKASSAEAKDRSPAFEIKLGRHDVLTKTIYAQLKGDPMVLALPDTFLDVLPKNAFSFRDRALATDLKPTEAHKVTVRRGARTDVLVAAGKSDAPHAWRMLQPVEAIGDAPSIARMVIALSQLRAEGFLSVPSSEGAIFGLDHPAIEVTWEAADKAHTLKVGRPAPKSLNIYASMDGQPQIFLLSREVVRLFEAEFHDHHVLSFPPERARRLVLRWPYRAVALRRKVSSAENPLQRGEVEWEAEPGSDVAGLDLSRMAALVATLSRLETERFIQYEGDWPIVAGLKYPRLSVEVSLGPNGPNHVLRIGVSTEGGKVCAALGADGSGPSFLLPGPPWNELVRSGEHYPPIPDNPFAPAE